MADGSNGTGEPHLPSMPASDAAGSECRERGMPLPPDAGPGRQGYALPPSGRAGEDAPTLPRLTGIVLTGNSQRLLDRCLASLFFCTDILVVDSLSTDDSLEIARRHKARILSRPWTGIGEQFAFALQHVDSEWIVILDSDEVCSRALADEITGALAGPRPAGAPDGYYLPRRSWYFDRFVKYAWRRPDTLYRLFRNGCVRITMSGVHQTFHPVASFGHMRGEIIHYPYASFANHLEKLNGYAQGGAADLAAAGERGGAVKAVGHAVWRFIRLYFLRFGFLDGRAGFILACHASFYVFLKYIRLLDASWGAPFDHE
ncbi:MAG: glycosyltransferase family 2 protein [Desulfovibrio sp.]|jgi:glycosyltransferase involved in cell wall biosynthesis|nr:glycosyltransferase family 2 protein [Desulfovibrio sp.]